MPDLQVAQNEQGMHETQDIQNIVIDDEFKLLLPALDKATYVSLEESLLQYGCRDPLILWDGILVDGFNRFEICRKHDIPFKTVDMQFDSRDWAMIWIIATQISRRNLNPFQLAYFRGMHYNAVKRIRGGDHISEEEKAKCQNGTLVDATSTSLANQYNVSRRTIMRDAQLADALTTIGKVSYDAQRNILSGKTRISRKALQELTAGPEEEVASVAARIEEGTYVKSKPDPDEAPTLEREYKKASDGFFREVSGYAKSGDAGALRVAFRAYMEALEEMFGGI